MKKRGRPLTTPPWWEGTARSWQAVSPAERKRLRALQTRREAEWELVDGAIPLESLPDSCVAARTVAHDGSGPRALHELAIGDSAVSVRLSYYPISSIVKNG